MHPLPPLQVFTHPKWDYKTSNNDITLIKLASPAVLGTTVSPVCLGETSDVFAPGMKCVTSGWNKIRYGKTLDRSVPMSRCWAVQNN